MRKLLGLSAATLLAVSALAACGSDDDNGGGNASSGSANTAAPSEVKVSSFSVESPSSCSGDEALAEASWETEGAEGVSFSVDGDPVPADAGNPPSGSGNVPIPCDGESHDVEITASSSDGKTASDTKSVTAPSS